MGGYPQPLTCLCHSFALQLAPGKKDVVIAIGVFSVFSPVSISLTFFRNILLWLCLTERGSCMHSHCHLSTPGPSSLLSIDFCLDHGCPLSERVSIRRLGYSAAPHLAPGGRGKASAEQKKTLYGTIIHDREVLAPLSLPKRASSPLEKPCLKLLSFYPWPGIARLLRRWRLNVLLGPRRAASCTPPRLRHTVALSALATFGSASLSQLFTL